MKFLIDTNVISALAPGRAERSGALVNWMDRASDELALSVVTATEICDGIAKAKREGATRKAAALEQWWALVEHLYAKRILPIDLIIAKEAGALLDRARSAGHAPGYADAAIAATASVNGLILLSRNMRHFSPFAIQVLDPFNQLPAE